MYINMLQLSGSILFQNISLPLGGFIALLSIYLFSGYPYLPLLRLTMTYLCKEFTAKQILVDYLLGSTAACLLGTYSSFYLWVDQRVWYNTAWCGDNSITIVFTLEKRKRENQPNRQVGKLINSWDFVFILAKQFINARAYIIKHKINNTNY